MMVHVVLKPIELETDVEMGTNLLECIRSLVPFQDASCGGNHVCGKCKVRITEGTYPYSEAEKRLLSGREMAEGIHLACEVNLMQDLVVELPEQEMLSPVIVTEMFPDREYQEALSENGCGEEKPEEKEEALGAAVDLGTTTLAGYLFSLRTGELRATASMMNPQIPYGDDVISRIAYVTGKEQKIPADPGNAQPGDTDSQAEEQKRVKILQSLIVQAVQDLLHQMTEDRTRIKKLVLVGNTVMEHLFLGISPASLGKAPFTPVVKELQRRSPEDGKIDMDPEGEILFLPAVEGFIGADHLAALLAVDPLQYEGNTLVVDIGTNTEICFCTKGRLYVTSCATGPAFEGAQIRHGMRAYQGAIDRVWIDPVTLEPSIHILGEEKKDLKPMGICGSGILDAVAEMGRTGILQADGSFSRYASSPRIQIGNDQEPEYVLYRDENGNRKITVTQSDVRAIQLAKAALYAGIRMLFESSKENRVDRIILAGGFGYSINIRNAQFLGMFPDCKEEIITVAGNAAGKGASMVLLDDQKLEKLHEYVTLVEYTDSVSRESFPKIYADAMAIPNRKDAFPISRSIAWKCPGTDTHFMPEEVYQKDVSCLYDAQEVLDLSRKIRSFLQEEACVFPIIQNQEACICGAPMEKKAAFWAPGSYPYASLEELKRAMEKKPQGFLKEDARSKALLEGIRTLKKGEKERFYVEVQAPFSVLTALIDPGIIYAAIRKRDTDIYKRIMERLTMEMALYMEDIVKSGCRLLSIADPMGSMKLNGKKIYQEQIGGWDVKLLKKCRRFLKTGLLHICGQMAADLVNSGFAVSHRIRTTEKSSYLEQLMELAEDRKIRYIGPGCIRTTKQNHPWVYELQLTGDEGGKES